MQSPLIRKLESALVDELVKCGALKEEAQEKIAASLRRDIVGTVRDCMMLARGADTHDDDEREPFAVVPRGDVEPPE